MTTLDAVQQIIAQAGIPLTEQITPQATYPLWQLQADAPFLGGYTRRWVTTLDGVTYSIALMVFTDALTVLKHERRAGRGTDWSTIVRIGQTLSESDEASTLEVEQIAANLHRLTHRLPEVIATTVL
jgi:hypothetical protein